jgi:hypothetical protein
LGFISEREAGFRLGSVGPNDCICSGYVRLWLLGFENNTVIAGTMLRRNLLD